jgi:hypothetical protein
VYLTTALRWVVVYLFLEYPMTQHELNCAVAAATGETLGDVRRMGFSLADPTETNFDPEPDCLPPQVIDWDDLEAQRFEQHTRSRHHEPTAA